MRYFIKNFLLLVFLFLFLTANFAFASDSEKCTLVLYKDGEQTRVEREYADISPILEKIYLNNFDIGLTNLLTDSAVEDIKKDGIHIEIIFDSPKTFKTAMSHMAYMGYKTYVVKESGNMTTLPILKILLTYRDGEKAKGIGSQEIKPNIINVDQRRLRVISGDYNGYKGVAEFAYFVEDEYSKVLKMFEK